MSGANTFVMLPPQSDITRGWGKQLEIRLTQHPPSVSETRGRSASESKVRRLGTAGSYCRRRVSSASISVIRC